MKPGTVLLLIGIALTLFALVHGLRVHVGTRSAFFNKLIISLFIKKEIIVISFIKI
ncbi:hypothetical protein IC006_1073 [Sulfuracidifex tepidarius]|uniref:Uncharacterized protein n=1 Tax=Sulfuracidifex tepidarius TaxID=1294262 RepID=A0A510E213_9CREN|nr:hypothetical protein IC006_1073 [Sulfuracidifex tepidarius]BBG26534.1 hypothetical protein IC007_1048 [Sulfuracidifex tepidarius]